MLAAVQMWMFPFIQANPDPRSEPHCLASHRARDPGATTAWKTGMWMLGKCLVLRSDVGVFAGQLYRWYVMTVLLVEMT